MHLGWPAASCGGEGERHEFPDARLVLRQQLQQLELEAIGQSALRPLLQRARLIQRPDRVATRGALGLFVDSGEPEAHGERRVDGAVAVAESGDAREGAGGSQALGRGGGEDGGIQQRPQVVGIERRRDLAERGGRVDVPPLPARHRRHQQLRLQPPLALGEGERRAAVEAEEAEGRLGGAPGFVTGGIRREGPPQDGQQHGGARGGERGVVEGGG